MFPKYTDLILSDKHCWSLHATSTLHMCVGYINATNKPTRSGN